MQIPMKEFMSLLTTILVLSICSCGTRQGTNAAPAQLTIEEQLLKANEKKKYVCINADTTFHLSNGAKIGLFGWIDKKNRPTIFSDFVLSVCEQDTIIGRWGAVMDCRIKVNKDTLLVEHVINLPTGKNFDLQETVWTTEKIYFREQKAVKDFFVNRQIRKYTQSEIQTVLKTFETAKREQGHDYTEYIPIANKLFVATISGNKKARQYFGDFKSKFGPLDGHFACEYNDLTKLLDIWDEIFF